MIANGIFIIQLDHNQQLSFKYFVQLLQMPK